MLVNEVAYALNARIEYDTFSLSAYLCPLSRYSGFQPRRCSDGALTCRPSLTNGIPPAQYQAAGRGRTKG